MKQTKITFALDEHCGPALDATFAAIKGETSVVFDCIDLKRVNSAGAGKWIDFLRSLPATTSYSFTNCTPVFIGYLNAVRRFIGTGRIESFQLPFHCDACDLSFLKAATVADANDRAKLGAAACKSCKKPATPETDLDYYLGFLD